MTDVTNDGLGIAANTGAQAALRGFRQQALYSLSRILRESGPESSFQPEGREDLAVYRGAELACVVQVKARSEPLTMSMLGSPFFKRAARLRTHTDMLIASFGILGTELEGVRRREQRHIASISRKIQERAQLSAEKAHSIASRIRFELVDEEQILEAINAQLQGTLTAGNPATALDLLVWWIYQASESRQRLTATNLRDRLQKIGRYFAEREAHHKEWFTTIKPLVDGTPETLERQQHLADEYYRGVSARYSHIQADLDIRRDKLLSRIDSAFASGKQTVVIHGASGQGKTTLAIRYLRDSVPSEWRFMVESIENRRHAARVGNALADHLHAVDAPLYLLIDVAPTDYEWVGLVRELLDKPNVRILIAIRSEDLARRRASDSELGFPYDIPLTLPKEEAEHIYARLLERGKATHAFPSFADAWERFGVVDGPLLEFVYLITQTDSLRDRLEQQVRRLQDEAQAGALSASDLKFLHLCAVATAYESRVLLRPLAKHLRLSDPRRLLRKLENEYLIRQSNDRRTVDSLHPLRSVLLKEILADPAFGSTEETALEVLAFVPEDDLHVFLLYAFSRHTSSSDKFLNRLQKTRISSWHGAGGVSRALLWLGVRHFIDRNRTTIDLARDLAGAAWILFLAPDVAGAMHGEDLPDSLSETLATVNPELISRLNTLRDQLSPTDEIFDPVRSWLCSLRFAIAPQSEADWNGLAQVLFWCGRLDVHLAIPAGSLEELPVDSLSLEVLADLFASLHEALPDQYDLLINRHGEALRNRFREETHTPVLEQDDHELNAHFLVPLSAQLSHSEPAPRARPPKTGKESGTKPERQDWEPGRSLNDRAVYRASLLRRLFPEAERFSTQGYGHQVDRLLGGFELPVDDSQKSMPRKSLPLPRLVELNSLFQSLDQYDQRPSDWGTFATMLLGIRDSLASTLLDMKRSLTRYFERSRPHNIIGTRPSTSDWDRTMALAGRPLSLPMTAVDEWGLSSESKAARDQTQPNGDRTQATSASVASEVATRRYQHLKREFQDYLEAAHNFMTNAGVVCFCHGQWGRQLSRKGEIVQAFSDLGYDESKLRLSKHSLFKVLERLEVMQSGFESRLASLVDPEHLRRVKSREDQLFPGLWALWYQFCHHPERQWGGADVRSMSFFDGAAQDLLSTLRSIPKNATHGWTITILTDGFEWEDRRALAIQVDLQSATDLEEARIGAFEALDSAMGGQELGSLGAYALSYYWPNLLLVPTIGGVAIEQGAWVIPAFVLLGTENEPTADRPWLRALRPIPRERLRDLGLEVLPQEIGLEAKELQDCLAEIGALLAHISNFEVLEEKLDDLGAAILQEYFGDFVSTRLAELFKMVHRKLPAVIKSGEELCGSNQDLRAALVDPLEEVLGALEEDAHGGTVQLSLENAAANAQHFGELAGHAAVLRWAGATGSVEGLLGI